MNEEKPNPLEMNIGVPESWKDQKLSTLIQSARLFGFKIEVHLVKVKKETEQEKPSKNEHNSED